MRPPGQEPRDREQRARTRGANASGKAGVLAAHRHRATGRDAQDGEVLSQRLFPSRTRESCAKNSSSGGPRMTSEPTSIAPRAHGLERGRPARHADCPTLVMSADQDYSPVSLKEAYVAKMRHAELVVISDSRHATPVEQPDKFNAALLTFLAKQP